jgi:hypothetical protein
MASKLPKTHKISQKEADQLCADFLELNAQDKVFEGEKFIFMRSEVDELLAENPGGNLLIKHGWDKKKQKRTVVLATAGGTLNLQKPGCC